MLTTAERLATVEQMLGIKYLGMSSDQLEAELKPENALEGGRYPYILSDYQLRAKAIDPFFGENGTLAQIQREQRALAAAPRPAPVPSQTVDAAIPGKTILGQFDPQLSEILDGQLFIGDQDSVAIYFQSDMSNTDPQRAGNRAGSHFHPTAPHLGGIVKARDGGLRFFNNFAYVKLDDGSFVAIIPDPTRYGRSVGFDAEGMWSDNIHVPEDQPDAHGFYRVKATHRGQLLVAIPDMNGDFTLRLPQGADLYIERGEGGMGANASGHTHTVSRQKVLTDGVNYPAARGGLHG